MYLYYQKKLVDIAQLTSPPTPPPPYNQTHKYLHKKDPRNDSCVYTHDSFSGPCVFSFCDIDSTCVSDPWLSLTQWLCNRLHHLWRRHAYLDGRGIPQWLTNMSVVNDWVINISYFDVIIYEHNMGL